MKKTLLAAAISLAFSGTSAFAASTDGSTNDGSGDVILVAVNGNGTESYFLDLEIGGSDLVYNDFLDLTLSFTITDPGLTGWIAANSGVGSISYNIFGLSQILGGDDDGNPFTPPTPNTQNGWVQTSSGGVPNLNGGVIQNTISALENFILTGPNAAGQPFAGGAISGSSNNPAGNAFF
ncbi:MAG: hypothetical protein AAF384_19810, partial [Pseudomonadota bacterium]